MKSLSTSQIARSNSSSHTTVIICPTRRAHSLQTTAEPSFLHLPRLLLTDHFHARLCNLLALLAFTKMRVALTILLDLRGLLLVSPSRIRFFFLMQFKFQFKFSGYLCCLYISNTSSPLVSALNISHRRGLSRADNNYALSLTFSPTFL